MRDPMPEALTESFCERCGTRYEFEAPQRLSPLRKTRGLVAGFKNYLTSQEPLSDAIGDAFRSEEQELAATQLDAFHAAFNFCIDCRQYACTNCWNEGSGRCRSCAPIAGTDDLVARLESAYRADHSGLSGTAAFDVHDHGASADQMGAPAWPAHDLVETNGAHAPESWPSVADLEPGSVVGAETTSEWAQTIGLEPMAADAGVSEATPGPEPVGVDMPMAAETSYQEPEPVLAWESDVEFTLAPEAAPEPEFEEYELQPTFELEPATPAAPFEVIAPPEVIAEPEPEPVAAVAEPEPQPIAPPAEPEAEPIAAAAEQAPEPPAAPVVPEPRAPRPIRPITPVTETVLRVEAPPRVEAPRAEPPRVEAPPRLVPRPAPTPIDHPALAARKASLDLLGLDDPGVGTVPAQRGNVLPYRSSGAAANASDLAQRIGPSPLWDASAREVAAALSAVGVQSCGECGLSLSASARFCRRCGTQQARSA
jgi:hypothetical protein